MRVISIGEFKRLRIEEIKAAMPFRLTAGGEPFAFVAAEKDIIVISDLHIRVRNQMKAKEKLARSGMLKEEKVHAEDLHESV